MKELDELLDAIDAFSKAHDMSATRFGRLCMNDTDFVHSLRRGDRAPHLRTIYKVREFIADFDKPKRRRKRPLAELAA